MNIKEKLKQYSDLYTEIMEYFECDGYLPLDIMTDVKWLGNEDSINYFRKHNEEYVEYGFEYAKLINSKGDHSLFYIQENGEKFYGVFSDDNKLTEEQYETIIETE